MDRDSSESSSSTDDIQPIVDERVGQFLSSTPPVAEQILRHLCAKNLNSCACVCKLWSQIAEAEKRRRHDIVWMFQATLYPGLDDGIFSIDGSEHFTDDMIYMSAVDDPWGVGNHFYEVLEESPIQPEYGVMFCSTTILSKPQRFFSGYEPPSRKKKKTDSLPFYYHEPFMQYLSKELPANCRMICCGTPGIVGTPSDNSVPSEVKDLTGFSACLLPHLPGIEVLPFSVAEEDGYNSRKRRKFDDSDIALLTGIPESMNVKALLVFCEEVPDRGGVTRAIVQHYMKKKELKIALGGAIVDSVVAPMRGRDEWPMVAGIALTGDSLNAASMVIHPHVNTVEELEKNLKEFKSGITLKSRSIAFMFACCGKGSSYYEAFNVEPKAFRKVFPNTLLLGCFSNGEIGITYLPDAEPPKSKVFTVEHKITKMPNWVHGYTTIFVLLTW